jgi:hypothetical protein
MHPTTEPEECSMLTNPSTNRVTKPLRVLVVEGSPGAADEACDELVAAGHRVRRCHDRDAPPFPCAGMTSERLCPLGAGEVDVAIGVRTPGRSARAGTDDGVRCAIRSRVPLVLAGAPVNSPYRSYAAEVVERPYGVVDACERAATASIALLSDAATRVLADAVGNAATAVVHQRDGVLIAEVHGADGVAATARTVVAARVLVALREVDGYHRTIDVHFA